MADFIQCPLYPVLGILFLMPLELDKEDVLERVDEAGPAVDACEIQVESLEAAESLGQSTR